MFLRAKTPKKDGKEHRYWSVVENRRVAGGRVVQRHVLYLGEINSSQAEAWRSAIEVFDEEKGRSRSLALFVLACAAAEFPPAPRLAITASSPSASPAQFFIISSVFPHRRSPASLYPSANEILRTDDPYTLH